MIKKVYITFLFMLTLSSVTGQFTIERSEDSEILIVYKKQNDTIVPFDSLSILNLFSEEYYSIKDSTIYLSWSSTSIEGKTYYLNTYQIQNENSITLNNQYWIEEDVYKDLFNDGLKISLTKKGLKLSFDQGKIASIVLFYDELNLNKIKKTLSKLSKL